MTAPKLRKTSTLFNMQFKNSIQRDSVEQYHKQLSIKKGYLTAAQNAYQTATGLVEEYNQKIIVAQEQLVKLNQKLATSTKGEETQNLSIKKQQCEQFIENAPKQLEPHILRLKELADKIQELVDDINQIEQSASE